ncbi:Ankyrin repeat protein (25), partial [Monkeypox virus]
NSMLYGKNH